MKTKICHHCDGSGWAADPTPTECPHCVDGRVPAVKRNTCPGCGGPGQKNPAEEQYWCPNGACDVALFDPRQPND